MMEEDEESRQRRHANLPIPTYEEATSSRPASSQNHRGPQEVSDDAERQGLLGRGDQRAPRPPTVESPRSSEDSDLGLPEVAFGNDDARRHIEELDYLDPEDDGEASSSHRDIYHRARLRRHFSKQLASISATFSSLRIPSFRSFYSPVASADTSADAARPSSPPPTPRRPAQIWRSRFSRNFAVSDQYRMSLPVFARLCGLFTLAAMIYILFALDIFPRRRLAMGMHFEPESVRMYVQDSASTERMQEYLQHVASYDHVAGTEGDYYLAKWMQEHWLAGAAFDEVALLDYHVYLNYPTHDGRSVKITEPEGRRWKAQIEENLVDPSRQQTLAWHGHSKSGEATGHLVYANGGSKDDFKWLQDNGVETEGAIALVRHDSDQHEAALKVKAAERAGCVGVLIYSDPSDDGSGKGRVWPDGRWRPADSVRRAGVGLASWILGDPLTPGWSSKKNSKTFSKGSSYALPQIPSLPLPWRDAKVLIDALEDQGIEVPKAWVGGTQDDSKWFSGSKNGPAAVVIELRNKNEENEKQEIWNVHGFIQGLEQQQKKIIVGNHRDAWCFGAADPGSGTAVLMEVAAIFTKLVESGWRPLRSIEFVSWDAGEFNLMGSTEYVEERIDFLRDDGVAYLNVGAGVFGKDFHAAASPLWQKPLLRVLGRITDPTTNDTLRQIWDKQEQQLLRLEGGGDFVAFQSMAGMSSIDFGFKGPEHGFPAQSCYDTYEWMEKFGDPDFEYHRLLAQIWALLILEVADRPLVPFNLIFYAKEMQRYTQILEQDAVKTFSQQNTAESVNPSYLKQSTGFDVAPLRAAAENLTHHAEAFHEFETDWSRNVRWAGGLESAEYSIQRLQYNERITRFETDLLDLPDGEHDKEHHGIPGREQYKHVVFGPQLWSGYEESSFPAVRDAMDEGNWEQAQAMIEKAARILERAGKRLVE